MANHTNQSCMVKEHFFKDKENRSTTLIVLLHAYTSSPEKLSAVRNVIADPDLSINGTGEKLHPDIYIPKLPASLFSMADPIAIVHEIHEQVDHYWRIRSERPDGKPYENILLIGHSLGALLARKLYIHACGETRNATFESSFATGHELFKLLKARFSSSSYGARTSMPIKKNPSAWATNVRRIILLAATNRGWSISHHMSIYHAVVWSLGTILGNMIILAANRTPLIFKMRKGASFITQLRLQWLAMRERYRRELKECINQKVPCGCCVGGAKTIQLLGSVDDMVSPDDNIDLVTGKDFIYRDVPTAGHANVIAMGDVEADRRWKRIIRALMKTFLPKTYATWKNSEQSKRSSRRNEFVKALTWTDEALTHDSVALSDMPLHARREEVNGVIFVIHGIRDLGYWTHKIARKVQALAKNNNIIYATETSSYGYFPMLSFLLPAKRRQKVEWFMDQYAEAKALYPNAEFSFVGHSNGTYLLTDALTRYPSCKFKHVILTGSVVSKDFDWAKYLLESKQVEAVLNYVTTHDWVVAFFPKAIQQLKWQDLGSAGHDGFEKLTQPPHQQIKYVFGGHSGALKESNWDDIARFIVNGPQDLPAEAFCDQRLLREDLSLLQKLLVKWPGSVAPLLWVIILSILAYIGALLWNGPLEEMLKTALFFAYLWGIYKVLTRL